ncbi:MAG: DUF3102 domain-containing protein [Clostridia bacterium]|nr:DUF3102 domain-containing protein [Clostridia bacterium]
MDEMKLMRTPEVIAGEINVIKAQAREVYCRSAIEIGRRLTEAKAMVPHGSWLEWLEVNVEYSERTAQELMRMYEEYGKNTNPQAIADLNYTQAVILLGLDRETRTELLESGNVADMSTRDLREEVRRLNEEIEKRQVTIDQLLGDQEKAEEKMRDAEAQMDEVDALREEREKAMRDAEKARRLAEDMKERAEKGEGEARRLRAELEAEKNKPEPLPVVEKVEVVPPDVEAELNALRERARTAPNEKVVLLREAYRQLTEQFKAIEKLINEVDELEPATAERYRVGVAKGARLMADRLVGGE